jgi:hypothetical protein
MGNRNNRIHPALKHAGYSAISVLPGENKAEFDKLHQDLIAELVPNGPLESDIVATMARLLWRKQNLKTFRISALARGRRDQIRYETIPRDVVEYDYPMLGSVKKVDPAEREAATRVAEAQIRAELGDTLELMGIGDIATVEHLMKDLEVQDRLDSLIDRCLKRLLFVRGLKSISTSSSTAPEVPRNKRLAAA